MKLSRWRAHALASVSLCLQLTVWTHAQAESLGICFEEAGSRYTVAPVLLKAIAVQESGMRANALNRNRDGTWDIGLMQINSRWIPTLARFGITEKQLWDPCVSVHVGAWVLAGNFQRLGHSWEAVGAYNAASPDKRHRYAQRIQRQLQKIQTSPY